MVLTYYARFNYFHFFPKETVHHFVTTRALYRLLVLGNLALGF